MEETKPGRRFLISVNKVNTIMKSSSDIDIVSKESSTIMSKAAELFLKTLTQETHQETIGNRIDYKHLSTVVHRDVKYSFLREIVPKKITVKEFKEIMAKKKAAEQQGHDISSSSAEEEAEEEEEEVDHEEDSTSSSSEE